MTKKIFLIGLLAYLVISGCSAQAWKGAAYAGMHDYACMRGQGDEYCQGNRDSFMTYQDQRRSVLGDE